MGVALVFPRRSVVTVVALTLAVLMVMVPAVTLGFFM